MKHSGNIVMGVICALGFAYAGYEAFQEDEVGVLLGIALMTVGALWGVAFKTRTLENRVEKLEQGHE